MIIYESFERRGWPRGKGGVPGGKWASQKRAAENTRFLLSRLESDNAMQSAGRAPGARYIPAQRNLNIIIQ